MAGDSMQQPYQSIESLLSEGRSRPLSVAVVIPCYKVKRHILAVLDGLMAYADAIYVVDDCCPERVGDFVRQQRTDPKIHVLIHDANQGVGGATITGYRAGMAAGFDVIVKFDGDGQMDPSHIPYLLAPFRSHSADYVKGNRFFNLEDISKMPPLRVIGNAGMSFLTKLSSGYWDIFDPANGFTAIHARILERLPLDKIDKRYFFESDMLFRLGTLRARVFDAPMAALYGDETSGLSIARVTWPFWRKSLVNFAKRIFYNYFLRNFSIGSTYLLSATVLTIIGVVLGVGYWTDSAAHHRAATSGQVMLAALPLIFGAQMLLSFLSFDIESTPKLALHPMLMPSPGVHVEAGHSTGSRDAHSLADLEPSP